MIMLRRPPWGGNFKKVGPLPRSPSSTSLASLTSVIWKSHPPPPIAIMKAISKTVHEDVPSNNLNLDLLGLYKRLEEMPDFTQGKILIINDCHH